MRIGFVWPACPCSVRSDASAKYRIRLVADASCGCDSLVVVCRLTAAHNEDLGSNCVPRDADSSVVLTLVTLTFCMRAPSADEYGIAL